MKQAKQTRLCFAPRLYGNWLSCFTTLDFCFRHLMLVAAWNEAYSDAQLPTHEDSLVSEEANTPVTMQKNQTPWSAPMT